MREKTNNSAENPDAPQRIAKFLAAAGLGSRRQCEEFVTAGLVQVNGTTIADLATRVRPGHDQIRCRNKPVVIDQARYLLLNKPPGFTCSARDSHAERLVAELLPAAAGRLFTVGRLDRDSEGLLLCTNDGDLAQSLAHPRHEVPKYYEVTVAGEVDQSVLRSMENGLMDNGEFLAVRRASMRRAGASTCILELTLTGGKKREIRRLCSCHRLRVTRLLRVGFGPLRLGNLASGACRPLTPAELQALRSPHPQKSFAAGDRKPLLARSKKNPGSSAPPR